MSTASRLLGRIDEELFLYAFMEWAGQLIDTKGRHVAIDGKALRGGTSKVRGERTPMLLNAIETVTGLVLAQLPLEDKENEIVKIPEILRLMNIKDSTITIDAIGTQTGIMEQIVGQGGHFVMVVKKNQPASYEEIRQRFEEIDRELAAKKKNPKHSYSYPALENHYEESVSREKNRDRYEYRRIQVCSDPGILSKAGKEWPFVKTVGVMRQERILLVRDADGNDITPGPEEFFQKGTFRQPLPTEGDTERDTKQVVGIISDRELSAEETGKCRREHWSVENRLHHVLDDTFREDRSPAKCCSAN